LLQSIYNYTANIHGSDPYWFQQRRELMAQAEQEGLLGTLFWTFSAAENHWKDLMSILGVPENAGIAVRRKAVMQNPNVVNFYFCRRIEKAVTYILRKCLMTDWIWYRYKFQMRGATHAHGMVKLKIAPDILDAVAKVYAGRKAADIIEYRTGIHILHFPSYVSHGNIQNKSAFAIKFTVSL